MPGHKARRLARQPLNKGTQTLITQQAVAVVVGQGQFFFTKQSVNLVMASTAHPERCADAFTFAEALLHIDLVMQSLGNQMVTRQGFGTGAELADIGLCRQSNRFRHTGSAGSTFAAQAQAIAQWQQGQVDAWIITQRQVERLNGLGVGALGVCLKHATTP
jgi:hypothetical protein